MDLSISHRDTIRPHGIAAENRRLGRTRRAELFHNIILGESLDALVEVPVTPGPATAGQNRNAQQQDEDMTPNRARDLRLPFTHQLSTVLNHAAPEPI